MAEFLPAAEGSFAGIDATGGGGSACSGAKERWGKVEGMPGRWNEEASGLLALL